VLHLKTEAGRAKLLELVRTADVLVENYTAGVTDRLGLGYPWLR
jgi:formyl-CoA transferase